MAKSLLEQLPEIVAKGRQVAEKILENLEGRHRVGLQTREWVLPAKDNAQNDLLRQFGGVGVDLSAQGRINSPLQNRLIYGDNLLAMAALLAGDEATPSLRGKIDLIYIDPPFDSKADYRTKVTLPSPIGRGAGGEGKIVELEQKPTVIEQFAYSDTWADGTASYLAMITPRLILMRELLSDSGSIYVHLDWHVGHYVKIVMDEVFGKDRLLNEVIWHYQSGGRQEDAFSKKHDAIFIYTKSKTWYFNADAVGELRGDKKRNNMKREIDDDGRTYFTIKSAGKIYKYYEDEKLTPSDVWTDISHIQQKDPERVGYGTQKPKNYWLE